MQNTPAMLRRRAEAYRAIARDIGTFEVRERLDQLASQLDRRADIWSQVDDRQREPA